MTTRGVIGDVHFLDDSAAEGDIVLFRLERVGFAEDAIYMPSDVETVIQADGTIVRVELWASAEGGRNLLCILPNGFTWRFRLEPGDTDITLQELHALNTEVEPALSPTIQNMIDAAIELDFAAERARYANAINAALGDALIGYQNAVAGAVSSTVHDRLNEWVSASDLGLHGDGEPESVEALGKLLDFPSNRTLILPDGSYDLSEMPQIERVGDLYLSGQSMGTVDLIGLPSLAFLYTSDSVVMRDLTLSNWGACLSPANTRSRDTIDLERVRMRDSVFGVITASLDFNPDVVVDRFRAVNSVFERCGAAVPGAGAILFWVAFNNAYAHGNRFNGNVCRAIQFGRNLSTVGADPMTSEEILAYQELFANSHVTDNSINGMTNGSFDQTIHGILVYGRNGIIIGNHTRDTISTAETKEATAIYTKCRNYIVYGNPIDNLYHSAGAGGDYPINIKGSPRQTLPRSIQGYGGSVIGNPIKLYGRGKNGIRLQDEQVIAAHNVIDSPAVNGFYVSSGINDSEPDEEERGFDDITLALNQVHGDPTLTGVTAYNITTIGDRLKVLDNVGTDVMTLVRDNPTVGTPKDHTIGGNTGARVATLVRLSGSVPIENVDIITNHGRDISPETGNASVILVDGTGGGSNLRVAGNTSNDVNPADGTATVVNFSPNGPWRNVTIKDNPGDAVNLPVPAMLTAVLTGDAVSAVAVVLGGRHYRSTPTLVFTRATGDTTGTGAAGTPVITDGVLTGVVMTNGGSNYTLPPIVTTSGGNDSANSGYHTRISGVEADTIWIDPGLATNIKTRKLQIDTPPRNRVGPIEDDTGRWNPANCPTGTAVSTTVSVATAKKGARCNVAFVEDIASGAYVADVEITAKCLADGVVTVRLKNESGVDRNLNLGTIRLWMENP